MITMNNTRHILSRGDRLYASLSIGQRVVAAGMLTGIDNLTELLGYVRKTAEGVVGLARLQVKSLTRGWSFSRPLRLYETHKPEFGQTRDTRRAGGYELSGPWDL